MSSLATLTTRSRPSPDARCTTARKAFVAVVVVVVLGDDDHRVRAHALGVVRRPAAVPQDRQLGRVADAGQRGANENRLGAVLLGHPRRLRPIDVDDDRDAVSLGDRLTEPSAAPFRQGS